MRIITHLIESFLAWLDNDPSHDEDLSTRGY